MREGAREGGREDQRNPHWFRCDSLTVKYIKSKMVVVVVGMNDYHNSSDLIEIDSIEIDN